MKRVLISGNFNSFMRIEKYIQITKTFFCRWISVEKKSLVELETYFKINWIYFPQFFFVIEEALIISIVKIFYVVNT